MSRRWPQRYPTLLASLPDLGDPARASTAPISRLRLDRRLALLEADDAALLRRIEGVLQWSHQPLVRTEAEIVAEGEALLAELGDDVLGELVAHRLELRTLVAALRRRAAGEAPPAPGEHWGFGPWLRRVPERWNDAAFGLAGVHPWLPEAERMLRRGDATGLERLLLGLAWERLSRATVGHDFDFPAVVIYVLKWNILDRWTGAVPGPATARFERLAAQALAGRRTTPASGREAAA